MTITSGFAHPSHRTAAVATELVEPVEPVFEPLGVDDPGIAHGGRPQRMPIPPVPGGLVTRVRPPVVVPTKVRRIHMDASGVVKRGDPSATCPAPTPDSTAEVALPGVKPNDVNVTVEDDTLTIRGTYQHPAERNESGYVLHELGEGEFSRSLTLPGEITPEGIQAKFEDGLLKVSIPRSEAPRPRRIEAKVT